MRLAEWAIKKVHVSYVVTILAFGVVVGVAGSFIWDWRIFGAEVWVLVAVGLVGLVVWKCRVLMMCLALAAGVILGAWRANIVLGEVELMARFVREEVVLRGKVFDDPELREDGRMVLRMRELEVDGLGIEARFFVRMRSDPRVRRGDIVSVRGVVADGFGNYAGSMFRATIVDIERPMPGDVAGRIRDGFAEGIREYIDEPEVTLGLSYLLGQRRGLSEETLRILRASGLTHIVVVSGFHLMILVKGVRKVFEKVSRMMTVWASFVMIVGFTMVAGASPSMVRAGIMAGIGLAMWLMGRKIRPAKFLVLVAAITLVVEPAYIVDVGWQLSFGALLGVMLLGPICMRYLWGGEKIGFVRQTIVTTWAAQMTTLPVMMFYFGQVSLVAVITNVLVLPVVPFTMLGTFLTGVFALGVPILAEVFGFLTSLLLRYNMGVMEFFGELPWAVREVETGVFGVVAIYAGILVVMIYMAWRNHKDEREDAGGEFCLDMV